MLSPSQIFQFRLSLEGILPEVWRRIHVPADFTLAQLHRVIQAAMGWQNYHLHEFIVSGRTYGIPDPDFDVEREVVDDRTARLRDLNLSPGTRLAYLYDFGDDWHHILQLEDVLSICSEGAIPLCLAGEHATPPEDVGGVIGYEEFLEALADRSHEEHEHMMSWVGRPFDPKYFSNEEANRRLRKAFRRRKVARMV
jgi:hypothetical protein